MKIKIAIIAALVAAFILPVIPISASFSVAEYTFGTTTVESEPIYNTTANMVTFLADKDFNWTTITIPLTKTNGLAVPFTIYIYKTMGYHTIQASAAAGPDSRVLLKTISTTTANVGLTYSTPNIYPVNVSVRNGWYIAVVLERNDSDTTHYLFWLGGGSGSIDSYQGSRATNAWSHRSFSGTSQNITVYGTDPIMPLVTTGSCTYGYAGQLMLNGTVNSLGNSTSLYCYFKYGLAPGEYTDETGERIISGTGSNGQVNIEVQNPPLTGTVYYTMYAYSPADFVEFHGAEMSKTLTGFGGDFSITANDATKRTNNSALIGWYLDNLGPEGTVNVYIWLNTVNLFDDTHGSRVLIESGYSTVGNHPDTVSNLLAGTTYYYMIEADSGVEFSTKKYYSTVKSFSTLKSSSGGPNEIVNKANDFWNNIGIGPGVWWIITAALMAAVWLLMLVNRAAWMAIVCVIIDVVILGAAVTLVFDPWVTVVLAVFAAVVIAFLFVKNRGS
jgi:hypothetical protein